jgi:DNA helicase-2/ATP-dependent DNA helicase PcrA
MVPPEHFASQMKALRFGAATAANIEGNKLTIDFDKAGRKMVLESFVRAE